MLNDDVFVDIVQLHQVLKQLLIIYKAIKKEKNYKIKFHFYFIYSNICINMCC